MSTITWISTIGGDWSDGANWSGGVVPGAADDAVMNLTAAETIAISTSFRVHSVLFDDINASYVLAPSGSIVAQTSIGLTGKSIGVAGALIAGGDLTLSVTDPLEIQGTALLSAGGTIQINSGGPISIGGAPGTIVVGGTNTVAALGSVTVGGTGSITLAGSIGPGGGTIAPSLTGVQCFAAGTGIATPAGRRSVETLRPGDLVALHDGGTAPIVWIGRRAVNCRRHPAPHTVHPIRVARGAFDACQPSRDLFLSPDHAVYVAGVLIPIRCLIDGVSIVQTPRDTVEYFHIELGSHEIVLAEGLPVETWLDTGERAAFDNSGPAVHLHPRFGPAMREGFGYAPLSQTGPAVEAVRQALARRVGAPGRKKYSCQ